MGADSNAYTSDDLTVYHILAGKKALPKIVEIEADRFQNLKYSEPDFEKEARAVLGEYNKGASNPMQKMYEALYDNAFTKHTYKHTTIGFLKDIEAMPKQFAYSRQFFDRYYRPDNVTLLLVGDVDTEAAWKLIEQHYGGWKGGPPRPAVPAETAPDEGEARHAGLEGGHAAHVDDGIPRARVLHHQRRPARAGRAGRADVRGARASVQEAGHHRAEGGDAVGLRTTPTSIPTCSW